QEGRSANLARERLTASEEEDRNEVGRGRHPRPTSSSGTRRYLGLSMILPDRSHAGKARAPPTSRARSRTSRPDIAPRWATLCRRRRPRGATADSPGRRRSEEACAKRPAQPRNATEEAVGHGDAPGGRRGKVCEARPRQPPLSARTGHATAYLAAG